MPGRANRLSTALIALLILVFTGGPVLLALYGSLVPDRILLNPALSVFDTGPSLESYRFIFTGELPASYLVEGANRAMISDAARQVPQSLWNSSRIALAAMVLNLLVGAPAAFIYARYAFPGKKVTFLFIILSPLVPTTALVVPVYLLMQALGLIGSVQGIILVHTVQALPFTILILSVFFRRLPAELFEAAALDRCTGFSAFLRIAVPLALPSIGATGLFAFMLSYSEYVFSLVLSGDARSRPVSVVMAALARNTDVSWSLLNASIFLALIPTLLLVVLVWRFVVEGLISGAVKG